MPIQFSYDAQRAILTAECAGVLTIDDLHGAMGVIMHSAEFPPSVSTLWDCRRLDFKALGRGFEEQLVALRATSPERGHALIAIVVAADLDFGLTRMYELKSSNLPQRMMVFRDVEKATDWLVNGSS